MANAVTARAGQEEVQAWDGARLVPTLLTLGIGLLLWFSPRPQELTVECWHLFAIFVATITGMITKPLPVAPVVLTGVVTALLTQTAQFDGLFSPFSQPGIWLIVLSFFLAQGLIQSGLALRISYGLVSRFGSSTIGLAYAVIASELILAPFIPSLVARSGGVIFPIASALARESASDASEQSSRTPAFILLAAFHGSLICSNLFLTAMAGNPLCVGMAHQVGIDISWNQWALAAFVPGLFSLITVPLLIYQLCPPSSKRTPKAPEMARQRLAELGPLTFKETASLIVFTLVLSLWVLGPHLGISSLTAALCGLVLFLFTGVLRWKDCLAQHAGWDTLLWLGAILGLGGQLKAYGFFDFLSQTALSLCSTMTWGYAFLAIVLFYFYSHYLFASNIAHASSMFLAFLLTSLELGAPPFLAFFTLAFVNNIFGGLTHYASGPAPIYFGENHISLRNWWIFGFLICTYNLGVWLGLGSLWWKYLGFW